MVSANHVNYWNYLESVTANRNKEKLTSEGLGLQQQEIGLKAKDLDLKKAMNESQMKVNVATESKFLADAISTLENIGFSERSTRVKEKELDFQVNKWADQFGLDKSKLKKDLLGLDIELHKIAQDRDLTELEITQKREAAYLNALVKLFGGKGP